MLSVFTSILLSISAHADQFAFNSRLVCSNAVSLLREGSLIVSFCSQCDEEHVEVWRIKKAFVADTQFHDQFEVVLFAKKLYRSRMSFKPGDRADSIKFDRIANGEESFTAEGIDLAYLYVQGPAGKFRVLAKQMGLQPLYCAVETINLPHRLTKV
jgi:hypothetical protein